MKKPVGQFMRLGGLIIEMLGVWAVFQSGGDKPPATIQLPGMAPASLPWIGIGLGFLLWLVGSALVYSTRSSRKAPSSPKDPDV